MFQKFKNIYHLLQALLAALYYNFPSKKLSVIGVTGTDGKTTTVNMIYHILKSAGKKVSMISSVNAIIGHKTYDTGFHVSTPSSWQVQKFLREAVEADNKYFVIETTSHGLDQNRLAFVNFTLAVLTNITHEHLDYHKTYENYRNAKLKLFKKVKFSVINADDSSYNYVKNYVSGKVITYRRKGKGDYNLSNTLAAIAATGALGIKRKAAQTALKSFPSVKGRMEEVKLGQPFRVIVDFAHTPNGLEQALRSLRSTMNNRRRARLIAVFGSAGLRDRLKRKMMGEIAANLAHLTVITAEDPRTEKVEDIIDEIAQGLKEKGKIANKDFFKVPDRQKAIELAIVNLAQKGDVVATFGKSHEKSMTYGHKDYPWDEFKVARDAIKKRLENL